MALPTIPISQVVDIVPGVVGTGGNPLSLNAVVVSSNTAMIPTSALLEFASSDDVAEYFGSVSIERTIADKYFAGYDNSFKKPGMLYFAGYAKTATSAWLRGVSLAGMTLDQLKTVTGLLSVSVDGVVKSAANVTLTTVTSFTDAATKLTTQLGLTASAAVTWDVLSSRFVITSGTAGVLSTLSLATGAAAESLGLDAGYVSNGIAIDSPASAMDRIKQQGNNWVDFFTSFDATTADDKLALRLGMARWSSAQRDEYLFIGWDDANGYLVPNNDATFGRTVEREKIGGTLVVYGGVEQAAALAGYAGSIDFKAVNGRATAAFKSQEGLATTANTLAIANAVLSNNATYYGAYGARGGNLDNCFYDGRMNGSKFKWADTYLNQVYLNSQLRLAIWFGLRSANSVPYNALGETLIRAWCADPIAEALNNGSMRVGVPLSSSQKATINQQAGLDISSELYGQGYYLQILQADAQTRGQRKSPPCKLWYMDGGSVHSISLASIAVL